MDDTKATLKKPGKKKALRPFDFSKHSRRHIALQLVYLGWDYQGYAVQDTTDNTIEARLFYAFTQTRLIESRETSCYHRCGRTDKGVSAFGQTISIAFRSALCTGRGLTRPGEITESASGCTCGRDCSDDKELPYARMINRNLPNEIRILAWSPASVGFSARFDCSSRMYHYTFTAPEDFINIDVMSKAASLFTGRHDFRNLSRADRARSGQPTVRDIFSTGMTKKAPPTASNSPPFGKFEIVGSSFLWHQVRCILAVLIAIGRGQEPPELVETLLDIEKTPEKPPYSMAADFPLVLAHCQYKNSELQWHEDKIELARVADHFEKMWTNLAVRTSILGDLVTTLRQRSETASSQWSAGLDSFLPAGPPKILSSTCSGTKRVSQINDISESTGCAKKKCDKSEEISE